jgi:hypothetical protein
MGAARQLEQLPVEPEDVVDPLCSPEVENLAIARAYLDGEGPFPERAALNQLAGRFLTDFYGMISDWIVWAGTVIEDWPDDVRNAPFDRAAQREAVRRGERTAAIAGRAAQD